MSMGERLAAEREMRKRDREESRATGRMRPGILYGETDALYIVPFYNTIKRINTPSFGPHVTLNKCKIVHCACHCR